MINFKDYLRDIHAKDYVGLDDDMSDHFEHWLSNLDGEEYILYADEYATKREAEADLNNAIGYNSELLDNLTIKK